MNNFLEFSRTYQRRVEEKLETYLIPSTISPSWLHESMRYSTLNGGKRFRALLVYACGQAVGVNDDNLLDAGACAVELIHAYSLIHDDLPAMDNSDLRRGKLTCHLAFDEATAILAGDALQALAFEVMLRSVSGLSIEQRLSMLTELVLACGTRGMAGGQALDLRSSGMNLSLPELIHLHQLKTGALIKASAVMGALAAKHLNPDKLSAIRIYAQHIGLAFQIKDDILDISDTTLLGKPAGLDRINQKNTFITLLGQAQAQNLLLEECDKAIAALEHANINTSRLVQLAEFVVQRQY